MSRVPIQAIANINISRLNVYFKYDSIDLLNLIVTNFDEIFSVIIINPANNLLWFNDTIL